MGVMQCSRNGCQSILCDRYSSEFGYICEDCVMELENMAPNSDIAAFMASRKRPRHHRNAEKDNWRAYLREEFNERR
jgi:hypothetical protein